MKLQRREKMLAGLTLGLIGLAGLWFLFFFGESRSDEQLIADQTKLTDEIKEKEKLVQAAGRDAKRLAEWQRRALPAEPSLARSLYRNWLSSLAARANLRGYTLVSNEASVRRDQFTRFSFTLRARARLGDLVEFMYEFYSAGLLHQIRKADVKPIQGSRDLDVNLTIEALSLPTAESKDRLPKDPGSVLQFAKLSAYREPIVSRDFFSPYVRPDPPPPPRRERTVDPADFAFVNAFTKDVNGAWKVWLQDRMGGKSWQLGEGESFAVGNLKGTVQAIHPEGEVVIDFNGHRRLLHIEDNLHGGVEISDQPASRPDPGGNSARPAPDRDN